MKIDDFLLNLFGDDSNGKRIDSDKVYELLDYLEENIDNIVGIDTVNNGNMTRLSLILNEDTDLPGFGGGGNEPKDPKRGPKPPAPKQEYVFELEM